MIQYCQYYVFLNFANENCSNASKQHTLVMHYWMNPRFLTHRVSLCFSDPFIKRQSLLRSWMNQQFKWICWINDWMNWRARYTHCEVYFICKVYSILYYISYYMQVQTREAIDCLNAGSVTVLNVRNCQCLFQLEWQLPENLYTIFISSFIS